MLGTLTGNNKPDLFWRTYSAVRGILIAIMAVTCLFVYLFRYQIAMLLSAEVDVQEGFASVAIYMAPTFFFTMFSRFQ